MSETPELDDLIRVVDATVAIGRALQAKRDEFNEIQSAVAEAGAAGCRDLIVFLANEIRDAAERPIVIVNDKIARREIKVIRERPGDIGWEDLSD